MDNVVILKEKVSFPQFEEMASEIRSAMKNDSLTELVILLRKKDKDSERGHSINHYWFGKTSSILVLGLLQQMVYNVSKYIDES